MRKILLLMCTLLLNLQSAFAFNVDAFIDNNIAPITNKIAAIVFTQLKVGSIEIPYIMLWILVAGFFFTFFFKGISILGLKHSIDILCKKPEGDAATGSSGEVSSFQALATALSGTIGVGSIAGVAISISMGGPGAAFWIFAGAILGMSIKFIEASLAVKYRRFNLDGSVSGGPMHYIAHGLTRKKMRKLGQFLSIMFAVLCIGGGITGGNMIQINQSAHQLIFITGGEASFMHGYAWVFGLIVAILIGLTVVGGIKSIAKVTTVLVPTMCATYIVCGLAILLVACIPPLAKLLNATHLMSIGDCLALIVKEAFNPQAISGGFIGVLILGLRRSVQSNEAGTGAAAIVYSTAQTKEPVSQGFVALIETLLTGILCLFTSVVIVITGAWKPVVAVFEAAKLAGEHVDVSGIELASNAFESVIPFFPIVLSIVAIMFAISTLISWAYYCQKAWTFLVGEGKKRVLTFNIIYCIFIVIGSAMNVKSVIDITDAMMIAMTIPNIIVLYILAPEIKKELDDYCERHNLNYFGWVKDIKNIIKIKKA